MTHPDLNPYAAPHSNTSTAPTAVSLRDLFAGSFTSVFDGADGALRTGLRITLVAIIVWLCSAMLQSLLVKYEPTTLPGSGLWSLVHALGLVMAVAGAGEFVGACFLWKGMPGRRFLAACCCGALTIKFLFEYLMPRFLSAGDFGVLMFIVRSVLGAGFSITRLLLMKQLTSRENLRTTANIVIAGTASMTMFSIASIVWQISLNNTWDLNTSGGRLAHAGFLFVYLIVGLMEIRVVYRVLCEKLTASNESIA